MKTRAYFSTVSCIFVVIAIAHFIRALNQTPVLVGAHEIPMWVSWIAAAVGLYLGYQGYKLRP